MNNITKSLFSEYIKGFKLQELFNYLGWNNDRTQIQPFKVNDVVYRPKIIADKNGFKIIECISESVPLYSVRTQILNLLRVKFAELMVIFTDSAKLRQVWLYGYKLGTQKKRAECEYRSGQDPQALYERAAGLFFSLDEEDNITIIDVTARVRSNFTQNAERVTKRFYNEFKQQHTALLRFITGITAAVDKEWYASIMLNRLMFCYFMQKRGFLNQDRNYLRNKLRESKEKLGKGKFYSFYCSFLLTLFQKGFGTFKHSPDVVSMIGKIPYLNGGLFDLHEIERQYPKIDISDEAFESIFDLFDRYEWHLDTRECASGNEISPDVLGYIFEKYINDRAAMGAYYTQEDITDYISRSTILPYLLEATKKAYGKPFEQGGVMWKFLQNSGDRYIFDSVKRGVDAVLPDNIAIGVDTTKPKLIERRKEWNKPVPDTVDHLPTEIWREFIERTSRYRTTLAKIENGEIINIADFITYNLDIIDFINDLLDQIEDPKFIQVFYAQLEKVTVLDPTCGSGAFLFAALNILEPLYDSCLSRMADYLSHDYKGMLERGTKRFFDEKLEQMENEIHLNKSYFIYKAIILNNLYGVDIMKEAVETAKLRLFLKLVSTAEPNYRVENIGIEPLPDIDFNIKAGNTLIGFANKSEIDGAYRIGNESERAAVYESIAMFATATSRYKQLQLGAGDYRDDDFKTAKDALSKRQGELRTSLDKLLRYNEYGGVSNTDWQSNYSPFHWVAEFYSIIIENGGFDVIIGNPPYVVYSERQCGYVLKDYRTQACKDLYAFVIERSTCLIRQNGKLGMIIPISLISTDGFQALRNLLYEHTDKLYFSSYSMRPAKLFEGVEKHLTVMVAGMGNKGSLYSSKYFRWKAEYRDYLFDSIQYVEIGNNLLHNGSIPKINSMISIRIFTKLISGGLIGLSIVSASKHIVYHTRKLRYFLQFLDRAPKIYEENGSVRITSELKQLHFRNERERMVANAVYLSTLFFWYYISYSDCRNLNKREVITFPYRFSDASEKELSSLAALSKQILENLQENSIFLEANYAKYGRLKMQTFKPKLSKPIADKIDMILAEHYGFTEEELDYIINYDIKYRMGLSDEDDEDDGDDDEE